MDDDRFELGPPLYLVGGETGCWQCHATMSVVAVLCENVESPDEGSYILSNTAELPRELTAFIQRRCPTYRLTYSKTVGRKYYANNCPACGMVSGDFYLHSEPGAPFFPTDAEEAKALTLEVIPLTQKCLVRSGCGYGTGDLILQYARRKSGTSTENAADP